MDLPSNSLAADLRLGFRLLRQQPLQSALAILALALGIGGVTAQFSVVDGVLLKGLPFENPEELQFIERRNVRQPNAFNGGVPYPDFRDWSEQQTSFTGLAGYLAGSTVNVTIEGEPHRLQGAYITEKFMDVLGVQPARGRALNAEDYVATGAPPVILSHVVWQEQFGAREDVLGRTMRLNGKIATVVGVMAEGFRFPQQEQIWVPVTALYDPAAQTYGQNQFGVNVMARLKPGVSLDQAQVEMDSIASRIAADHPDTNRDWAGTRIRPLASGLIGDNIRNILFIMLGSVVVVLLLACLNVANLQLARLSLRSKELAIRSALGASRRRLVRQVLTESLALAIVGAIFGVLLAAGLISVLNGALERLPFPLPFWINISLHAPELLLTVGATLTSAVLAGLLPALYASRPAVAEVLKETGRGLSSRLLGVLSRGIVISQIALACALLICCGLFVRSILKQNEVDVGWDTAAVLSARLGLFEGDYPTDETRELMARRLREQVLSDPQFSHAAITSRIRMQFAGGAGPYEVGGASYATPDDRPFSFREHVSAGYFETINITPTEGRVFTELDDRSEAPPVVIVNESFAKLHFPDRSAVGERLRYANGPNETTEWFEIVGVVPDLRIQGPFNQGVPEAGYYVPFAQDTNRFFTVYMRGPGEPTALASAFREALAKVDPNLPPYFVATPATHMKENLAQNYIIGRLFAAFGGVALLLASVGLYGVMAFSVGQRSREFGIRLALGSTAARLRGLIFRQGSSQLAVGLAVGLTFSVMLVYFGRAVVAQFLFAVQHHDPVTWIGVVLLLTAVAALACTGPSIRAGRASALEALRAD